MNGRGLIHGFDRNRLFGSGMHIQSAMDGLQLEEEEEGGEKGERRARDKRQRVLFSSLLAGHLTRSTSVNQQKRKTSSRRDRLHSRQESPFPMSHMHRKCISLRNALHVGHRKQKQNNQCKVQTGLSVLFFKRAPKRSPSASVTMMMMMTLKVNERNNSVYFVHVQQRIDRRRRRG
jgi:hypothetical protein